MTAKPAYREFTFHGDEGRKIKCVEKSALIAAESEIAALTERYAGIEKVAREANWEVIKAWKERDAALAELARLQALRAAWDAPSPKRDDLALDHSALKSKLAEKDTELDHALAECERLRELFDKMADMHKDQCERTMEQVDKRVSLQNKLATAEAALEEITSGGGRAKILGADLYRCPQCVSAEIAKDALAKIRGKV